MPTFLLFCVIVLFSSSSLAHPPHFNNLTDRRSLLEFKAALTSDPLRALANWNPNISFCRWRGVTFSSRRQRVVAINLPGMHLEGTISPFLANLSFLHSLHLGENHLHGVIPPQLGRLFRLRVLYLYRNALEGAIPHSIPFGCRNLETLALSFNSLSGSVPGAVGLLARLKFLYLGANNLTGTIPSSLGNLSALTELDLSGNNLEGAIPVELEYGLGATISTNGDIYSFGIVLLEMLTRKRPTDNMFVDGLSLQKWVSMAYPKRILEVVDNGLLVHPNDDQMDQDKIINCLIQLIQVALLCTSESPQERPNMREIVCVLEKIRGTFIGIVRESWLQSDISYLISNQVRQSTNVGALESQSSSTS